MNFKTAEKKSRTKKILGIAIILPTSILISMAIMNVLYFSIGGTTLGDIIAQPFKRSVELIHSKTHFLNFFWELAPIPNVNNLIDISNAFFFVILLFFYFGLAFFTSGKKLARRLVEINVKIENKLIEESINGVGARSREDIEHSTELPVISVFSQVHISYVAPIITTIIAAIVLKLVFE